MFIIEILLVLAFIALVATSGRTAAWLRIRPDSLVRTGGTIFFVLILLIELSQCSSAPSTPSGHVGNGFWIVCFLLSMGAAVHSAHHGRTAIGLVLCLFIALSLLKLMGTLDGLSSWIILLPVFAGLIIFGCTKTEGFVRTLLGIFAGIFLLIEIILILDTIGKLSFSFSTPSAPPLGADGKFLLASFILFVLGVAWKLLGTRTVQSTGGQGQSAQTKMVSLSEGSDWLILGAAIMLLCGMAAWVPDINARLHNIPIVGGIVDWIGEIARIISRTWRSASPLAKQIVALIFLALVVCGVFGGFLIKGVAAISQVVLRLAIAVGVFLLVAGLVALIVRETVGVHNSKHPDRPINFSVGSLLPSSTPATTIPRNPPPNRGSCPPPARVAKGGGGSSQYLLENGHRFRFVERRGKMIIHECVDCGVARVVEK